MVATDELAVVVLAEVAADQLLAAAVAVDVGRVEEGDAGLDGAVQHRERVTLVDLAPVGPQLPGPESDRRHETFRLAQHAFFHPADATRGGRRGPDRSAGAGPEPRRACADPTGTGRHVSAIALSAPDR